MRKHATSCLVALQPYGSALNNAAWTVGLLIPLLPPEATSAAVPAIAERLIALLACSAPDAAAARRVRENAAISLGRVAAVAPEPLAPPAAQYLGAWCHALAALQVRPRRRWSSAHAMLASFEARAECMWSPCLSVV